MADERVVKVTLAVDAAGFGAKMANASKSVTKLGTDFKQEAQTVGVAMTALGVAASAAVGVAVKKFADFDQAISYVKAATHETTGNMKLLRDAALEAGARTVFSATESANAIEELAKAGVSTADILSGGLNGALDLAAAGGLGVADAANIAATSLIQFGLKGKDMAHVADLLAAGAGKAQGDVTDLSEALKFVGPVAAGMGVSIEETTGTLAAFASQGILAEQAGTGLRGMLAALTSPSSIAKKEIDRLGITLYDAQGKFLGLSNMAGQLQQAYGGMTDAEKDMSLGLIFGNQQVTAARVLLKEGQKGVEDWTSAVNDQGYAAETARIRLNNLSGDLEQLGGAFDTLFIKVGSGANGPLRDLVQWATDLVTALGNAPSEVQSTILVLGGLTAAAALAGGAFFLAVPKIVEFKLALATLNREFPAAMRGAKGVASFLTGPWGIAIAASVVGVKLLSDALKSVQASSDEMANAVKTATTATELFKVASQGKDVTWWRDVRSTVSDLDSVLDRSAQKWHNYFSVVGDYDLGAAQNVLSDLGKELGNLAESDLPSAQRAFQLLAEKTDGSKTQLWRLLSLMPDYRKALTDQATELGINVTSTDEAANRQNLLKLALGGTASAAEDAVGGIKKITPDIGGMGAAAQDARGDVEDLADAISGFGKSSFDATDAQIKFQQSVDDVADALDKNGSTLDLNTQKGRDNMSAVLDVAQATNDWAAKQYALTGNVDDANKVLAQGRDKLAEIGKEFGLSGKKLQDFIDRYIASPKEIEYNARVQGIGGAQNQIDTFIDRNSGRVIHLDVQAQAQSLSLNYKGAYVAAASGGLLPGAPSAKDNMLIHAASGEFVTNARSAAVPSNRRVLEYINAGGTIPGFANGGSVGGRVFAPQSTTAPTMITQRPVEMTVYSAPGMSSETVGRIAADQLNFELRGA